MDELTIRTLLDKLAVMDSNNFHGITGVGEREGRIFSNLVKQKNFDMGHGIGRSGDVNALQPKAVGSSLMVKLTKAMTLNVLRKVIGLTCIKDCIVLPFATGMSITLTLLTLKSMKPEAEYVIWPRIDQKTCLKSILTANLKPIVIQPLIDGDELVTNLHEINAAIERVSAAKVLCVFSTTSCFAPRNPDKVVEIAKTCKQHNIFHVVNNAYGLQCSKITNDLNQAHKQGNIDVLISSTDKNFLVPVGGSIIYAPVKKHLVEKINKFYPGRASAAPLMDLFLTLL